MRGMREERKVWGQMGKEVEAWRREILPSPTESEPSLLLSEVQKWWEG